jgi:cytochrome c oxidase assembly protein subunit 15
MAQIMFATLVSIALMTSRWWLADQPQFEDKNSPSIHAIVTLNAGIVFLQVAFGAAFRHKYASMWPHIFGAVAVLAVVIWTAAVLRRRFDNVKEMVRVRIMLHVIVGLQLLLGVGALWSRITTADDPQPMPIMVTFTVIHTVVGALLFATSIVTVLLCYRLVPRKREVLFATTQGEVPAQ